MKKRILSLVLSAVLLLSTALISASAAPKAPKIKKITVAASGKSATVTWNKVKSAKGYQIKYGYTKKLKSATTKTIAKSKSKITLKKLKAGKTLYVKIRAKYKAGKKTKYTKFSAVKSAKLAIVTVTVPGTVAPTTAAPTTQAPATVAPTTQTPTTAAPTTEAPTTTEPAATATTYSLYKITDSIRLIGRSVLLYNNIDADWSNSGFEVGMDCEGDVTVNLKLGGANGLVGVVVDEDFANIKIKEVASSNSFVDVTFDTNMESGYHKIRVIKLNEAAYDTNTVIFRKISVIGTPSTKPAEKDLKIEVIGDSITSGAGNLGYVSSFAGCCQDGSKMYASVLAQKIGADLNTVSRSGWGLSYSWQGKTEESITLDYAKSLPYTSPTSAWDFSTYQADIVLINLGTNDSTAINGGAVSGEMASADYIKANALAFCNTIRQNNPDCKIVWLEGMMGGYHANYKAGVQAALAELDNTYYCDTLPHGYNGIASHPNVQEHAAAAEALYTFLVNQGLIEAVE